MKKKIYSVIAALSLVLMLCACGKEAEPEVTPEPTPTPTPPPVEYTVTDESADEILALADIPSLKHIDATASQEYAALLELYNLRPDCEVLWNYEFEGNVYPNTAEELKATQLEGLEDAIRYLPKLNYIDVIDTEATVEDLDRYYEINPDAFYYWEFIHDGWRIRTDLECYSSLRDIDYHRFTDEEMYPMLKYCKHLKALDLGHDDIQDLTLIGNLKELEVLILADNPNLVDASPLANLDNLVYLEFFLNHNVEDYSFLNSLTKLKDLNLCYCDHLTDLNFLQYMPDMDFLMIKYSGVSQETCQAAMAEYPDPYIMFYDGNIHSCDSGWRDTQINANIRRAFTFWPNITDYRGIGDVDIDFERLNYPNY